MKPPIQYRPAQKIGGRVSTEGLEENFPNKRPAPPAKKDSPKPAKPVPRTQAKTSKPASKAKAAKAPPPKPAAPRAAVAPDIPGLKQRFLAGTMEDKDFEDIVALLDATESRRAKNQKKQADYRKKQATK